MDYLQTRDRLLSVGWEKDDADKYASFLVIDSNLAARGLKLSAAEKNLMEELEKNYREVLSQKKGSSESTRDAL